MSVRHLASLDEDSFSINASAINEEHVMIRENVKDFQVQVN